MDAHHQVVSNLYYFLDTLEGDGTECLRIIHLLEDAARAAIPSFLGWTIDLSAGGQPLSWTSMICPPLDSSDVASLRIPLVWLSGRDAGGFVDLFAELPGAFDEVAIDIARALQVPLHRLGLDLGPSPACGVTGLQETSTINQAIGVLVERGNTVGEARTRLEHDASITDLTLYRAAKKLTSEL